MAFANLEKALRVFEAAAWRQSPPEKQAQEEKARLIDVYRSLTKLLVFAYDERLTLAQAAQPPLPEAFVDFDLANGNDDQVMATVERMATKGLDVQAARDEASYRARFAARNLRVAAFNYRRVQKRQLLLAYLVVDQSRVILADEADAATHTGIDIKELMMQLRNADRTLNEGKMNLYGVWLEYLSARMDLYWRIGLMRLDENGLWLDDVRQRGKSSK